MPLRLRACPPTIVGSISAAGYRLLVGYSVPRHAWPPVLSSPACLHPSVPSALGFADWPASEVLATSHSTAMVVYLLEYLCSSPSLGQMPLVHPILASRWCPAYDRLHRPLLQDLRWSCPCCPSAHAMVPSMLVPPWHATMGHRPGYYWPQLPNSFCRTPLPKAYPCSLRRHRCARSQPTIPPLGAKGGY